MGWHGKARVKRNSSFQRCRWLKIHSNLFASELAEIQWKKCFSGEITHFNPIQKYLKIWAIACNCMEATEGRQIDKVRLLLVIAFWVLLMITNMRQNGKWKDCSLVEMSWTNNTVECYRVQCHIMYTIRLIDIWWVVWSIHNAIHLN